MGRNVTVPSAVTYSPGDARSLFPVPSSFLLVSPLFLAPFLCSPLSRLLLGQASVERERFAVLCFPAALYFYRANLNPWHRTRRRLITRSVMKASSSRAEVLSCSREPPYRLSLSFFTPANVPVSENGLRLQTSSVIAD